MGQEAPLGAFFSSPQATILTIKLVFHTVKVVIDSFIPTGFQLKRKEKNESIGDYEALKMVVCVVSLWNKTTLVLLQVEICLQSEGTRLENECRVLVCMHIYFRELIHINITN